MPRKRRSAGRKQWLAEVAAALAEAERIARLMADPAISAEGALALQAHIASARQRVELLEQLLTVSGEIDPQWIQLHPWDRIGPTAAAPVQPKPDEIP